MSEVVEFPRSKPESTADQAHAAAFRDMESEVCDLARMAELVFMHVMGALSDLQDTRAHGHAALLAQLSVKTANDFRDRYYARYRGERANDA